MILCVCHPLLDRPVNLATLAHSPAMNEVSRLRRRSYRNLLASPRAEMNDGDEREFRRRRTAEILESGRQQYEQNVQPLVMRSSSFDGPVGR